jgi:predicted nucleotidyltransferase
MVEKQFLEIEQSVREMCAERSIPVESVRFFGSRVQGTAQADSDVDVVLVSPAFEGRDIFERAWMTKGMHRKLVKRFKLPFDIVFCSIIEWNSAGSLFLQEIRRGA